MADYKILTIPFARDAVPDMVNDIPNDPSISEPQLASFKQGFPSITTIPLVAGGIPPEGQDFNGILRDITQHIVHQNKGGMYKFAPEVVADGGYPEGAVLAANDGLSLWVSLVDDNTEDFNTGAPTQWARIAFSGLDALLNNKLDKSAVVQSTGVSTTNVMSQRAVTDALAGATVPAGMVALLARDTAPSGWLKANGSAVSRTSYAALFAAIGTRFGVGDGSTTFNLPDLRGEFLRGWDDGRGVDAGRVFGSAQESENKAHFHLQGAGAGAGLRYGFTPDLSSQFQDYTTTGSQTGALHTSTAGGTESRPRNTALLACIKY